MERFELLLPVMTDYCFGVSLPILEDDKRPLIED